MQAKPIFTHCLAGMAGALLVAAVAICLTEGLRQHNTDLGGQVFQEKNKRNAAEAETIALREKNNALRDSGACDGEPIIEQYVVGKIKVIRGEKFYALLEEK